MWFWDSRTHQFIRSEALVKCRSAYRNMIKFHQELFILGIEAPYRWQNSFPVIEECLSIAVQNIANVFLSFEIATKIFQHQFRNSKLRKKVINLIGLNKYKLIKYSPGTISIRRLYVC
jgi:hypothetical protein